jgi:hypothetical protein
MAEHMDQMASLGSSPSLTISQSQWEELNHRLTEAENGRAAAERALRASDNATPASTRAQPSFSPERMGKAPDAMPKPPIFKGDRSNYLFWRTLMTNKVNMDRAYLAPALQQQYIIAFLAEDASQFIENYMERIVSGQLSNEVFWATLDARFLDAHRSQRAEIKLDQLKQGSKPFVEFAIEFEKLWTECGRDNDSPEKIRLLEKKLSTELRQLSVTAITVKPSTFREYADKLHN